MQPCMRWLLGAVRLPPYAGAQKHCCLINMSSAPQMCKTADSLLVRHIHHMRRGAWEHRDDIP